MGNILDELADYARLRVERAKAQKPLEQIREEAFAIYRAEHADSLHGQCAGSSDGLDLGTSNGRHAGASGGLSIGTGRKSAVGRGDFAFERALSEGDEIHFICECKKASPSKGLIAPHFPYLEIAREYEAAGASAISVLTEPKWFLGSLDYLRDIAADVRIPCLRKDFTVDPYIIYEAKTAGASAILLIAALLDTKTIESYLQIADQLGLSAIVEAHDEAEVASAVAAGARIIGVNNRNLKDFTVDIHNSIRLRSLAPSNVIFVAESGIRTPEDVETLRQNGVNAVLIGEQLMRAEGPGKELARLRGDDGNTPVRIKLCGLRTREDVDAVNAVRPEYAGFIFDKTRRRYIAPEQAEELRKALDSRIRPVGVFVDASVQEIVDVLGTCRLDAVQLHGSESNEDIAALRAQAKAAFPERELFIIKAFRVDSEADIRLAEASAADMVLLDNGAGGTGEAFDWSLLTGCRRPYMLAGGLTPGNVQDAITQCRPWGVDASSSLETDGRKDSEKIRCFAASVRSAAKTPNTI